MNMKENKESCYALYQYNILTFMWRDWKDNKELQDIWCPGIESDTTACKAQARLSQLYGNVKWDMRITVNGKVGESDVTFWSYIVSAEAVSQVPLLIKAVFATPSLHVSSTAYSIGLLLNSYLNYICTSLW